MMDEPHDQAKSRHAMAFRVPENYNSNPEAMEEDDSFYDLSLEEMKALYSDMLKQKEINDKLLPRSKREEEEKRLKPPPPTYTRTIIRIEFPDRTILQGEFNANETIGDVKEFVRDHVREPGTSFELFTSPPKKILLDSAKLVDVQLVPAAKLYVGIQNNTELQFQPGLTSIVPFEFAQNAVSDVRKPLTNDVPSQGPSSATSTSPQTAPSNPSQSEPRKVPKWFKMKK